MQSKWKLVIFDCDGVLVDSEPISCGVIAEMATEQGYSMTREDAIKEFAGSSLDYVLTYLGERFGRAIPAGAFEAIYRKRSFAAFERELQPIPFVREALKQIHLPKCVGSNGPLHKVKFNLNLTGLTSFFDGHLYSAYDIQKWKPLPDLYLHAAKQMGFKPSECLVVEDSTHGIQAAQAAEMDVVGYANTHNADKLHQSGALIIESMKELQSIVYKH